MLENRLNNLTMVTNMKTLTHWNTRYILDMWYWIMLVILGLFLDKVVCARGRHYVVTSKLIEPYLMVNPYNMNHTGNDRYMGYIADLMKEVANTVGINYRIRIVKDGQYGTRKNDGSWDGMIGELMNGEAGIAAAPLYTTKQREQVIDFTTPFLTVEATVLLAINQNEIAPEIRSARDLITQDEIRYGTLNTGITVHAFKHTNDSDYKRMFNNMKSFKPSVFTDSNLEGIERARRGGYAFIIPSTIGEYMSMQSPCDLKTVDRFLMNKHFALALPKHSYLVPDLNEGLYRLEKRQVLQKLYRKWWYDRNDCSHVSSVVSFDQHYASMATSCKITNNSNVIVIFVTYVMGWSVLSLLNKVFIR